MPCTIVIEETNQGGNGRGHCISAHSSRWATDRSEDRILEDEIFDLVIWEFSPLDTLNADSFFASQCTSEEGCCCRGDKGDTAGVSGRGDKEWSDAGCCKGDKGDKEGDKDNGDKRAVDGRSFHEDDWVVRTSRGSDDSSFLIDDGGDKQRVNSFGESGTGDERDDDIDVGDGGSGDKVGARIKVEDLPIDSSTYEYSKEDFTKADSICEDFITEELRSQDWWAEVSIDDSFTESSVSDTLSVENWTSKDSREASMTEGLINESWIEDISEKDSEDDDSIIKGSITQPSLSEDSSMEVSTAAGLGWKNPGEGGSGDKPIRGENSIFSSSLSLLSSLKRIPLSSKLLSLHIPNVGSSSSQMITCDLWFTSTWKSYSLQVDVLSSSTSLFFLNFWHISFHLSSLKQKI